MNKKLSFGEEARDKILQGMEIVYKAVSCTLGPKGRNVIIERPGESPHITKDGFTIAKSINLKDQYLNIGAQMIKEVALQTVEKSGDGPQPLDAKVLTPTGWTTMGELKIGDEICGTNNTIQKVLEIHPKGILDVYQVITSDNRIIECCSNHLWKVIDSINGKEKILTTRELLNNGVNKYCLPITTVDFNDNSKDLPIDPYCVGNLLDKIGEDNFNNTDKSMLSKLGLSEIKYNKKYIPKNYLYSTIENRKKLLDGITSCKINKKGLFKYTTKSKQFYLDIIELCRGLGKSIHSNVHAEPINGGPTIIFYTIKELEHCGYGIKIKKIEKTDRQIEMRCIKVSNEDHLYITNDYTPTHNTSTATILAYSIYRQGLKLIAAGHNSTELKKGIDFAVQKVICELEKIAKPIETKEDIIHIGTVSANGDKSIGEMICKAIDKVGRDGIITVEESKSYETTLETLEGMRFNRGYTSPYFVTNSEKMICELEEPYVLITNKKFDQIKELLPFLEQINKVKRPLLIISDDIEGEALHTLSVNKMKGLLNVCSIRAPEFGSARHDALEDIALLTGGKIISDGTGVEIKDIDIIKNKDQDILGKCKKVIVGKNHCILVAHQNKNEIIKQKLEDVKKQLTDPTLEKNEYESMQRRIARLSGGVAVIRVGGSTEVEMKEKKDRIDDALCAITAALQEGILPGGGTALARASICLTEQKNRSKDFNSGIEIIKQSCIFPLTQLVQNVNKLGTGPDVVLNKILSNKDKSYGWNASTETYGNLLEQGIIDPLKVPKIALQNAASVSGLALTVDAMIVEEDINLFQELNK